jgi:hypothetical protein
MKKQLLIAAIAATMASVSMADISISGGAKVNYLATDGAAGALQHDVDFTIAGKSGATTVSATVANAVTTGTTTASALSVENVYVASEVMGANIKIGQWSGSDSLLGNGSRSAGKVSADMSMGGIKVQYEDQNGGSSSVTVSGSLAGVAVSHEVFATSTDTKISGKIADVNATYRTVNNDNDASDKSSLEVSTTLSGVAVTYATVKADSTGNAGTSSDAFFGLVTAGLQKANGVSISTDIAGNAVTFKRYTTTITGAEDTTNKIVVTRALASGATFEATYSDKKEGTDTLDLELAVKF